MNDVRGKTEHYNNWINCNLLWDKINSLNCAMGGRQKYGEKKWNNTTISYQLKND